MPTTTDARLASINLTSKKIEKPIDGKWITSGVLGSRDSVLVFRTNILSNCNNKGSATGLHKTSTTSLSANNEPQQQQEQQQQAAKEIEATSKSVVVVGNNTKVPNNITPTIVTIQKTKVKPNFKPESLSLDKLLNESLSSSNNSISSDVGEFTLSTSNQLKRNANIINIEVVKSDDDEAEENEEDVVEGEEERSKSNCDTNCSDLVSNEFNDDRDDYAEGEENLNEDSEEVLEPHSPDMPALKLKLTYKFMQTETKLLRQIFVRHGLTEVEPDDNFTILWTGVHMKPDILRNLAPYQRVNHFPRSYEITRKDRMYKNIERMQHLRGMKHFDIVPQSFVLPLEYKDLISAHNKHRGPWIVKPAASSRGRGIFIVNSPDQISQDDQVLVSKYVADPLCIDGHKCDLRVYVLVTSFDPLIIYIYEEGLVRIATVKYELHADNLWNPCMHLCNYSINKYHSDYIKSSDAHEEDVGHKWTLSALLRHLQSQGCDTSQLMLNIEDLIIKALLACAQSVVAACRMFVPNGNNCFELYGFDILIDDALKPWLLEVNLSPSMGVDTPLDAKVKASLITDLLTCVGIPAYSEVMRTHYDSKWTRFRNVSYSRRTSSADPPSAGGGAGRRNSSSTVVPLTLEEQRIVRNARLQNARRGGFVRIFPTEDSMQRYGTFLDPATGIPMSTSVAQGSINTYSMILPHNFNQILFHNLYGKLAGAGKHLEDNSLQERMAQYTRALITVNPISFTKKRVEPKCEEEGKRLRKQILKLIDNGSELTQLQARQTFALYLEAVLRRLTQEPRDFHENLILKFLNRVGGGIKTPVQFKNPTQNARNISKARTAMVAKLLGDFLEQYCRDTEAYVDAFDHFGMIPSSLYAEFLSQAQEADLESILAVNTALTGTMPYLYNRCGFSVPPTPPIPSGLHGFLRALPAMVISGSGARDFNKYDGYYNRSDRDYIGSSVSSHNLRGGDSQTKKSTVTSKR